MFSIMFLNLQDATPSRPFDPDIVWQVFSQVFARLLGHLPYLILGVLVFVLFLVGARLIKRTLILAGRRTRLDLTLADLLGRLASAVTIILGLFVAAVVIFPTFNPGDLIAGLVRTAYQKRRVRLSVGIGYRDSIERARSVIREVLQKTAGVLQDPAPSVFVTELGPSSVNFNVFFWTDAHRTSALKVTDSAMTGIKLALDEAGIDIPYPHTVVLNQPPTPPRDGTSHTNP
jgi:hypothetical protein